MENRETLRIRQITTNGKPSAYNDLELGGMDHAPRGRINSTITRRVPGGLDTIAFCPDTIHNRTRLLQLSDVEVSHWDNKKKSWIALSTDWLETVFVCSKGDAAIYTNFQTDSPESKTDGSGKGNQSTSINNLEGFLALPKDDQVLAFNALVSNDKVDFKFKQTIILGLAESVNSCVHPDVKEAARGLKAQYEDDTILTP